MLDIYRFLFVLLCNLFWLFYKTGLLTKLAAFTFREYRAVINRTHTIWDIVSENIQGECCRHQSAHYNIRAE